MPAGNVIVFDHTKQYLFDGTLNLGSDTFKVALLTDSWTPDLVNNALWGDISGNEIANGNGYTTGGVALTSVTVTEDASANTTAWSAANTSWTATGAVGPFRLAAIYKSGTANGHLNPLVGYVRLDSADISISSGNTFTIAWNASGILTISGATA